MRTLWGLSFVLFTMARVQAQDTAALDKLLADGLKEMHNKAADLYNGGDTNGCYRMFQGGLVTARPLLAHRPDLQQAIDQGLQLADRQASVAGRAKALHDTIEAVRTKLKPPAPAKPADPIGAPTPSLPQTPSPPANPSPPIPPGPSLPIAPVAAPVVSPPAAADKLWKRLGGEDHVNKNVDDFLTFAIIDDKVDFTRGGKYPLNEQKQAELKQKFVAYISSISDGTVVPTSTRSMAEIHKGMKITDDQFKALAAWLKTALEKNNVAARDVEELMQKVNDTKKDIVAGGN